MLPTLERIAPGKVRELPKITGAEDFSFFANRVPGLFVIVGVTPPDQMATAASNHSPRFYVDEGALPTALARPGPARRRLPVRERPLRARRFLRETVAVSPRGARRPAPTAAARRAGVQAARSATPSRSATTDAKVAGSSGLVP